MEVCAGCAAMAKCTSLMHYLKYLNAEPIIPVRSAQLIRDSCMQSSGLQLHATVLQVPLAGNIGPLLISGTARVQPTLAAWCRGRRRHWTPRSWICKRNWAQTSCLSSAPQTRWS